MLKDKVALVTGASRGIGKEIAISLAKQGAFVVINYSGSEAKAQEVKEQIEADGGKAEICQCNVSDYALVKQMITDVVKNHGSLDILVNNAGITKDGLLMGMKEEAFDAVIDVNLKGTFNCMQVASKIMMKQRSGKIINMSSIVGVSGNAGQANYAASKAGVIGLTKSAAKELGSRNVTVNAIAPGFIATEMTQDLPEKVKEEMLRNIPLGRPGDPKEIASMVTYLASPAGDYITGQVFQIDGGMGI